MLKRSAPGETGKRLPDADAYPGWPGVDYAAEIAAGRAEWACPCGSLPPHVASKHAPPGTVRSVEIGDVRFEFEHPVTLGKAAEFVVRFQERLAAGGAT